MNDEKKINQLAQTLYSKGLAGSLWDAKNKARDILGLNNQLSTFKRTSDEKHERSVSNLMQSAGVNVEEVKKAEKEKIHQLIINVQKYFQPQVVKKEPEQKFEIKEIPKSNIILPNVKEKKEISPYFENSVEGVSPIATVAELVNVEDKKEVKEQPAIINPEEILESTPQEIRIDTKKETTEHKEDTKGKTSLIQNEPIQNAEELKIEEKKEIQPEKIEVEEKILTEKEESIEEMPAFFIETEEVVKNIDNLGTDAVEEQEETVMVIPNEDTSLQNNKDGCREKEEITNIIISEELKPKEETEITNPEAKCNVFSELDKDELDEDDGEEERQAQVNF